MLQQCHSAAWHICEAEMTEASCGEGFHSNHFWAVFIVWQAGAANQPLNKQGLKETAWGWKRRSTDESEEADSDVIAASFPPPCSPACSWTFILGQFSSKVKQHDTAHCLFNVMKDGCRNRKQSSRKNVVYSHVQVCDGWMAFPHNNNEIKNKD